MTVSDRDSDRPTVTIAARVSPRERRLAEMALDRTDEATLSAFVRGAVRDRAIRVATEKGVAPPEAGDAEVGR